MRTYGTTSFPRHRSRDLGFQVSDPRPSLDRDFFNGKRHSLVMIGAAVKESSRMPRLCIAGIAANGDIARCRVYDDNDPPACTVSVLGAFQLRMGLRPLTGRARRSTR